VEGVDVAIDISHRITNHFPRTEAALSADSAIDYSQAKDDAIAEAKRKLYGTATVPAEADLPDVVGEQIADLATIALIPISKEHYAIVRYRRKSNSQGENVEQYDLISLLDDLADDLRAACAERADDVEELVGKASSPTTLPQVSVNGLIVNPYDRALARGLP
jgi:hypothetical protein